MSSRTHLPDGLIQDRLSACRRKMQEGNLDGYLVTSHTDQFYLTQFDGEDGAALILPSQVWIITDGRFKDQVPRAAGFKALVRRGSLVEAAAKLTKKHRIVRLGFQPEALSVELFSKLRKALRPTRLVATPHLTRKLRLYKDANEIAAIQRAVNIAQRAFETVTRRIRLGMTERQLAAALQHEMLRLGAAGPSFPIIVAEGLNAAFPHAVPGDRKIERGSAVLIDWGASIDHYLSDLTRVVFIRKISPRIRDMYAQVLAAQEAALGAVAPGKRMCDVDAVARRQLKTERFKKAFSHSLGHGLGLDIHEAPRVSKQVKDRLEPGMVVTIEPGVYLPGIGGVRIEDDVLVTPQGCRVLTSLPKDLDAMIR